MANGGGANRAQVVVGALVVAGVAIGVSFLFDSDLMSTARTALGLGPAPGATGQADPALNAADRQLQTKLQPVIACINRLDNDLGTLADAYRDEVEYARGTLAGKKYLTHFNFGLRFDLNPDPLHPDPVNDCAAGLEHAAAGAPPVPDLDAAASSYARILRTMPPVFAEAAPYYKQGDWKDDHFTKGAALDAKLRPMFAGIAQASLALRAATRTQEDALRGRELAAVEAQQGRGVRWHNLNVIARARDVQNEADRQAKAGTFDAGALQSAIDRLSTAWTDADAYAKGHPEMTRAPLNGGRSTWTRITEPASTYLAAAKELRRAMEGRADGDTLRSDYQSTVSSFNSLVDEVNSQF